MNTKTNNKLIKNKFESLLLTLMKQKSSAANVDEAKNSPVNVDEAKSYDAKP